MRHALLSLSPSSRNAFSQPLLPPSEYQPSRRPSIGLTEPHRASERYLRMSYKAMATCLNCGKQVDGLPPTWYVVIEKGQEVGSLCPTCGANPHCRAR